MTALDKEAIVSFQDLSIGYRSSRRRTALIAERLNEGLLTREFVCLLGTNGAGKSTLLRTLAGMQPALGGRVSLEGKPLQDISAKEFAKRLSVVLTDRIDGEMLSAYSLVALGRYPHTNWAGTLSGKDHEIIQRSLATMGAAHLSSRNLSELSDGERQRVMVARALAQEPKVMILDEITAFLDLPRRVEVMQLLRTLAHESGQAILISTHDLDLALRTADRLWLMTKDGALITGAPEDLVLNGHFATAFASEGLDFDMTQGHFTINKSTIAGVKVIGEGNAARWTERALERQGFCVSQSGESHQFVVRIESQAGKLCWSLSDEHGTSTSSSIYDLSSTLDQKLKSSERGALLAQLTKQHD